MRKKISLLLLGCLVLMAFKCEDDTNLNKEQEQEELAQLKHLIEDLTSESICNQSTECKYIAFGSKPCGGPWSYLIYSTSINTDQLEDMVSIYNQKENAFNIKYNVVSDCSLAIPPSELSCENNQCIAIY